MRSPARPTQSLDLLYGEAPREAFDGLVSGAIDAGVDGAARHHCATTRTVTLRLREQIERRRRREAEMSGSTATASDLTAIRDVDAILPRSCGAGPLPAPCRHDLPVAERLRLTGRRT